MGSADLSKCGPQPSWNGAARLPSPTPPPPPQNFETPLPAAVPLVSVDLGSLPWTLSIDGGPTRAISVPAGGYNSDMQAQPFINSALTIDAAVYFTTFTVPALVNLAASTVTIEFGAVNYGAEIYINHTLVGVHNGPNMPFAVDISNATLPGSTYNLTVVSHPFLYYGGSVPSTFTYAETWLHPPDGWSSRTPNGISKYVRLVVHPAVRFDSMFVRPSVSNATLTVEIIARNDASTPANLSLAASLSSWNGAAWPYASVVPISVTVPPHSLSATVVLVIPWLAPPESMWWPNRPWNASYITQLHWFNATLSDGASVVATAAQRFGFVEHAEGSFYYTVNGVRHNQLSDGTYCET